MLNSIFLALFTTFFLISTTFTGAFHHPSRFSLQSYKRQTSIIEARMSQWDSLKGVWIGDKAISDEILPSPLYLFGYGSLLWRPGDLLNDFKSYSCLCNGWQRIFAQRSSDHRGSTEFPGFVCTLVEASFLDSHISSNSYTDLNNKSEIECFGLVWMIPEDRVEATIKELDYRERGGYHRHTIKVTMMEDSAHYIKGDIIDALVYSGSTSNPMFHYLLGGFKQAIYEDITNVLDTEVRGDHVNNLVSTEIKKGMNNLPDISVPYFRPRCATADVIAAAIGPSGNNSEYLFKLRDFMVSNGFDDKHLRNLSHDVSLRLGPWRNRIPMGLNKSKRKVINLSRTRVEKSDQPTIDLLDLNVHMDLNIQSNDLSSFILARRLLGWGSNEHQQLGVHMEMSHPHDALQSFATNIKLIEKKSVGNWYNDSTHIVESSEIITSIDGSDQIIETTINVQKTSNSIYEAQSQVLSGGAYSAVLDSEGIFTIWGGKGISMLNIDQSKIVAPISNKRNIKFPENSNIANKGESSAVSMVSLNSIIGAAMGYEHMLLLQESGWVVALGDNKSKQCDGPSAFVRNNPFPHYERFGNEVTSSNSSQNSSINISKNIDDIKCDEVRTLQPLVNVLKLAAGVRHSAAITMDGYLYVWGTGAAAKIDSVESHSHSAWCPVDNVKLIDVDCGMHHTVVVDEVGRVWSFGDDRFDSLGRSIPPPEVADGIVEAIKGSGAVGRMGVKDSTPRLVEGLEEGVRWQRVCCGWSHTVLRGIRPDGSMASSAWGRKDLGQYPTDETTGTSDRITSPQPLATLPNKSAVREVWTGSEFTVVADEEGFLWSCGWNEHGNLGRGRGLDDVRCNNNDFCSSDHWVAVMRKRSNKNEDVRMGKEDDDEHEHLRLTVVWEGALSCGGGHVICLTD